MGGQQGQQSEAIGGAKTGMGRRWTCKGRLRDTNNYKCVCVSMGVREVLKLECFQVNQIKNLCVARCMTDMIGD